MKLEEAIQQKRFGSEHEKAVINLLFTCSWLQTHTLRFLKAYDISPEQFNVLRILRGQHPKTATVSLIQERMLDKMSNASRLVEKLKQKGFVERKECKQDRRQVDVLITEKGLNLLKELDEKRNEMHEPVYAISKDEAKQLNEILDKLRTS